VGVTLPKPQPDFSRLLTVLRRAGEPDRVPLIELGISDAAFTEIFGPPPGSEGDSYLAWRTEGHHGLGYDFVSCGPDVSFTHKSRIADDTASDGQRGWMEEAAGPITSWEEFERYPWPEVTDASFQSLEITARHLPEGMKIIAGLPCGPMENLTFLMGFETFSYALLDQPDLVAAIAGRVDGILCQLADVTASLDSVGAQWLPDDMGFKGGPLAAPETLRRYVFPTQKRICEIAHRHGKPILLHSCGRLDVVMDELIDDVGIDSKHSFEDVIMPVWEAKRKWGGRIALLGGVDMDVLARGSEEQVRAYTRRCIEECAPGGGWALGSGNTIPNYVPVRNYLAMLDEGRQRGRYA